MIDLKLGDNVTIGADLYVVATVTGLPPYWWQLVRVPEGKNPRDLGKTWTRDETAGDALELTQSHAAPPSVSLEDPVPPPALAPTPQDRLRIHGVD